MRGRGGNHIDQRKGVALGLQGHVKSQPSNIPPIKRISAQKWHTVLYVHPSCSPARLPVSWPCSTQGLTVRSFRLLGAGPVCQRSPTRQMILTVLPLFLQVYMLVYMHISFSCGCRFRTSMLRFSWRTSLELARWRRFSARLKNRCAALSLSLAVSVVSLEIALVDTRRHVQLVSSLACSTALQQACLARR